MLLTAIFICMNRVVLLHRLQKEGDDRPHAPRASETLRFPPHHSSRSGIVALTMSLY